MLSNPFSSLLDAKTMFFSNTGPKLKPKEQTYVDVVKRLNAAKQTGKQFNAMAELTGACTQYEEAVGANETTIGKCWALARDIIAVPESQGISPSHRQR